VNGFQIIESWVDQYQCRTLVQSCGESFSLLPNATVKADYDECPIEDDKNDLHFNIPDDKIRHYYLHD
jgi:hypothetical protein